MEASTMAKRKTWREKLAHAGDLPKVETGTRGRWAGVTIAIPAPAEVDALMRRVPTGKVVTSADIRKSVADAHRADEGCPITVGIFAWIAAHAAAEAAQDGETETTPFWRTLKKGGELNPKYPGGMEEQRRRLEAEGHVVEARGAKLFVRDYGARLAALD
jgi:alkylated DNA nucleotide flippase Atl1